MFRSIMTTCFAVTLLAGSLFTGPLFSQEETVATTESAADAVEATATEPRRSVAIAPPPAAGSQPVAELRIGGLRKRIFSDRDSQRYRIDEENVFQALTDGKTSGDITDEMSIVEKARVIFRLLQTKPENAAAFQSMTKAKTQEERLVSVRDIANAVKAIMRILEMLESVFGEL